ncbi:DUF4145 domain-containing protein [Paenibacillus sp. FSL W8-1187]|uniref:DUF4145 domain-containing protein n=1 Tax=Paenibacillus sp. FSL W8-1187 TaxID=2975339 RepID=UPI0030D7D13A
MTENKEKIEHIFCNDCNRNTKHTLVADYVQHGSEEVEHQLEIYWTDAWYVWQCRGCDELTGVKTHQFSEDIDYDGSPITHTEYFPKRGREQHKPKVFKRIPDKLENIYKEIIISYNDNCKLLCGIGLRALLEGICVDKGVDGNNLFEKIDRASFVPENIRNNLHGFRFLGNTAAHELTQPELEDLKLAILVIEDVLNLVYDLDYRSKLIFDKYNKGQA